jgi:hypothetical protein
MYDPDYNH